MKQRVVVSRLGVIAPIGIGQGNYRDACFAGKSGVRPVTSFDASIFPTESATEIRPEEFNPWIYGNDGDRLGLRHFFIAQQGKNHLCFRSQRNRQIFRK